MGGSFSMIDQPILGDNSRLNPERLAKRIYDKRQEWCRQNRITIGLREAQVLAAECLAIAESICEEIEEAARET